MQCIRSSSALLVLKRCTRTINSLFGERTVNATKLERRGALLRRIGTIVPDRAVIFKKMNKNKQTRWKDSGLKALTLNIWINEYLSCDSQGSHLEPKNYLCPFWTPEASPRLWLQFKIAGWRRAVVGSRTPLLNYRFAFGRASSLAYLKAENKTPCRRVGCRIFHCVRTWVSQILIDWKIKALVVVCVWEECQAMVLILALVEALSGISAEFTIGRGARTVHG